MGALNDGVTERCGRVRGVIHEMWIVDKSEHPNVKDLQVVSGEGLQVSVAPSHHKDTSLARSPLVRSKSTSWLAYTLEGDMKPRSVSASAFLDAAGCRS